MANIYPKCYYGDEKITVFQNLVVDKGFVLLSKDERHGMNVAR